MNEFDFFAFAEEMATRLKGIRHSADHIRYFKANGAEETSSMDDRLSSIDSAVLIAVDKGNVDSQSNGGDGMEDMRGYAIIIVSPTDDNKPATRVTAVQNADAMLEQIRNVLKQRFGTRLVKSSRYPGDVLGDNFYGKVLDFTMSSYPDYSVDSSYFDAE
jgi:predicted RNA-binding protein with TRAM domain